MNKSYRRSFIARLSLTLEKNGFTVTPLIDRRSLIVSRSVPRGIVFTEILQLLETEDMVDSVDTIEPYHLAAWKIRVV